MRERKQQDIWTKMDEVNRARGFVQNDAGFTVQEYAERYAVSRITANHRLCDLVKEGKLLSGFRLERGRRLRVYRFPGE